ncbi:hypothetical protein IV203_016042 [Nitzschia inconspicua]|uniref:Uncharacterized protein n=1 Tax=Nitzschia inconspicua TaxID=303405 RepID=A0A9K3PH03_9STRA|nr:hypothetical protein IV203_016042 [Nitzschia inconspicua]
MKIFKNTRLQGVFERRFSAEGNFVLSASWVLSGLLAFLIPLIYRTIHKKKYEQEYMKYFWEKEYEYQEEMRQQGYEKYGNNYNYGGAYMYPDNYMNREYWDVNNCRWWQMNCFPYYVNQDGEPMPDQGWYPTWYSGWTVTEEEREQMALGREQPGSLKFVYVWQLLTFLVLLWYGVRVIRQNRNVTGLLIALFVWANFAFMSMWLMADNSIQIDGDGVFRSGFYGQLSVLIFLSNFWYMLHAFIFLIVLGMRQCMIQEEAERVKKERETVHHQIAEAERENYQAPGTSSYS